MKCISMAIEMLGGNMRTDALHADLARRLAEREHLCNKLGGSIHSRQIIACIIADWRNENPGEYAIFYHARKIAVDRMNKEPGVKVMCANCGRLVKEKEAIIQNGRPFCGDKCELNFSKFF